MSPLRSSCIAETGQHASVDHCLAQIVEVHRFYRAREIAGHAAGERIPCPGRIVYVFEWICATTEEAIAFAEEQRAVLTFLNGNVGRPHFLNTPSSLDETRFLRHFARFTVVQDQKINPAKQRIEIWPRCLDPKVHGVSDNETRTLHLLEYMRLQRRRDIGQKNEIGLAIRLRQRRL